TDDDKLNKIGEQVFLKNRVYFSVQQRRYILFQQSIIRQKMIVYCSACFILKKQTVVNVIHQLWMIGEKFSRKPDQDSVLVRLRDREAAVLGKKEKSLGFQAHRFAITFQFYMFCGRVHDAKSRYFSFCVNMFMRGKQLKPPISQKFIHPCVLCNKSKKNMSF